MIYPIAIMKDSDSCYGVTVPDLKGCFSAGDTLKEAIDNAKEAIGFYLEEFIDSNKTIPDGGDIEKYCLDADYKGSTWFLVEIDITPYLGKSVKVNVTLPEMLIQKIDHKVSMDPTFRSRSGFLQKAAIDSLAKTN